MTIETEDVVEAVARAIAAQDNEDDYDAWEANPSELGRRVWYEYARAALASPPIERLREENARHLARADVAKEALHEALTRYPSAAAALAFFWAASGFAEVAPTEEHLAWARAALNQQ